MPSAVARTTLARTALAALAGLVLLPALAASDVAAQGLRYTQTTRMEMGGGMGALMRMAGGMEGLDEPVVSTVWLDGAHTREDHEGTSTITDWREREVVRLDHDARTFRRGPLRDMARDALGGEVPTAERPEGEGADLGMRFRLEDTGETAVIGGWEAERFVLVLEMDAPMGGGGPMAGGGMTTAMVTELWVSEDFPAWQLMAEAREAMAAEWSADMIAGTLGALGPEMAEALAEQQEAMQSLRGTPLRVVTTMVQLPGGAELDVQEILETEDLGGGGAQASMAERMRQLMGGPGADPEPFIVLRTTTEVGEVEEVDPDPALFQVPEGYREAEGRPGG